MHACRVLLGILRLGRIAAIAVLSVGGCCGFLGVSVAKAAGEKGTAFASMYLNAKPFLEAITKEREHAPPKSQVTGISVPHHLLAADLIARGFTAASGNSYDRVIILTPDHFNVSRRPMATTRRDIHSVLGTVHNDQAATAMLLTDDGLFDDSDLFANEHGVAALLPFVRNFFPKAKLVPIAISYSAARADCDQALAHLEKLIGPHTLVVQSTDYSHYLAPEVARQRDQETLNVIAANDAGAVLRLLQPAHMDSKAAQYMQMQLQAGAYKSHATVIANRNSSQYVGTGGRTTSYMVTVYTEQRPAGSELRYPDQEVIYFGGDTFAGRWLTAPLADKDAAAAVLNEVKALTAGAPVVLNLEGVVLDEPPEGVKADLHAMHASIAIPMLKALNVKVAGLANNHSFDFGRVGFEESRAILQRSGIAPLGHKEIVDLWRFRLIGLNFIGKLDYRGYPVMQDSDFEELCRVTARPPVMALVHWGEEYTDTARTTERVAAEAMQACGVSLIVGAHPHQAARRIEAPQGGEYQLVYSLGNFLFDQTSARSSGALLELRAFEQGTFATRLIPIPNLFELAVERLKKEGFTSPRTSSAGNR
jgi:poly-gamma-glutamate synthesis protein (capsule biosynthesis protein)